MAKNKIKEMNKIKEIKWWFQRYEKQEYTYFQMKKKIYNILKEIEKEQTKSE